MWIILQKASGASLFSNPARFPSSERRNGVPLDVSIILPLYNHLDIGFCKPILVSQAITMNPRVYYRRHFTILISVPDVKSNKSEVSVTEGQILYSHYTFMQYLNSKTHKVHAWM